MINYGHSVFCITAIGAMMLPVVSRNIKSIERMREQVDEELQYRANHLLCGPGCDLVSDEQLWGELRGARGAWSMVKQGRLMFGIISEYRKMGSVAEADEAAMREDLRLLGRNFRLVLGEALTARAGDYRRHARALASSYVRLGEMFDGLLGRIDGQSAAVLS